MSKNVHVELLAGRRVRDVNDKVAGRIQSIHGEIRGKECYVEAFLLGPAALLSRLGISAGRLVGWAKHEPLRVPWQQLDLSDPEKPRLRCTVDELRAAANR